MGMREELAFLAMLFLVITLLKSQAVLPMIKELSESKGKIPHISPPSCSVSADFTSEEAPYCSEIKYFLFFFKKKKFSQARSWATAGDNAMPVLISKFQMNHSLCLAGYAWKPCELLKCCVEHNSGSLFLYIFNKTNKETVALEGRLIHSLHGPVPRHLCSCPALYLEDDTPP